MKSIFEKLFYSLLTATLAIIFYATKETIGVVRLNRIMNEKQVEQIRSMQQIVVDHEGRIRILEGK